MGVPQSGAWTKAAKTNAANPADAVQGRQSTEIGEIDPARGARPAPSSFFHGAIMAKVNSALPRFKGIERRMRDAANNCRSAIEEIDAALAAPRTEADRALLLELRSDMADVHARAKSAIGKMFQKIQL